MDGVLDLNDAQDLANEIQKFTGENLSYNTIRRFFGLVKHDGSVSNKTLNILSKYLGYKSYQEFQNLPIHQMEISAYQSLMQSTEIDFEVNFAEQLIAKKSARDILSLAYLLKYLLEVADYSKVARILGKTVRLRLTEDYYENCVALANFCGDDFLAISKTNWIRFFIEKTAYPQVVLLFYSSTYSTKQGYYDQISLLNKHTLDPEEKLFALSSMACRALIKQDRNRFLDYAKAIEGLTWPKVIGADLSARLQTIIYLKALYLEEENLDRHWTKLLKMFKESAHKMQFLKEPVAIFFCVELEKQCRELLAAGRFSQWEIRQWTENGLNQVFHISKAYYAYLDGEFAVYLRHKAAIERKYWFNSIYDLLELMYNRLAKLV